MKPRDQVAPRERHAEARTVVERDLARAGSGQRDELPVPSNERPLVQALDGGLRGAGAHLATGERELQRRRVGERRVQLGRHAVGRHDVEADGRQEDHVGGAGLAVAREGRLEDGRLAGDVEVMHARTQACVDHRAARLRVRTGAVKDEAHSADALDDRVGRGQVEHTHRQAQACPDRLDGLAAATGHDGMEPTIASALGDERAREAVGAVDEERVFGHARGLPTWHVAAALTSRPAPNGAYPNASSCVSLVWLLPRSRSRLVRLPRLPARRPRSSFA